MEIIRKNGKRVAMRYEDNGGTGGSGTPETTASIKTKLGAASPTHDGYLTKEDYVLFQSNAGSGGGSGFNFGTFDAPSNVSLSFGTF